MLMPMAEWCDEHITSGYTLYYCNRGARHSLWNFYSKDDAVLFKLKFGGEYSQHVQSV
jgi:hypothetical protein